MPLQIIRQDITKMNVDAIVNTTNEEMVGYSGVDEAIHTAAGALLDAECEKIRPLFLGEAKVTKGYNLNCKYIIHTSGPVWHGGDNRERELLESCYKSSLMAAVEYGCETVAFPLISSGVYCYPKDQVLKIAVSVITEFLFEHELTVYLCVFDKKSYSFSKKLFAEISEFIDDEYVEEHDDGTIASVEELERLFLSDEIIAQDRMEKVQKMSAPMFETPCGSAKNKTLQEYMKLMDKSFAFKLFDLIDERGMTDIECYKKANIDKKTFSKIKCNPKTYKPSKQTAVAFAIALRLNLEETQDLLASAGLTLSRSFTFDKIIRYFIQQENYDIFEINEALFEFDQVLLGNL
jgi:O-acetyl-ADP-ribose deacetylase (regulator of RNase III)